MLISLYAIELGATTLEIGALFSLSALCSLFLALYAGRISDRLGPRLPMIVGSFGLACGLLLPYFLPRLATLYFTALLIGVCYIFFTVSTQHLIGSAVEVHERNNKIALYSLAVATTALLGPTVTGFSVDAVGHRWTYLVLALLPMVAIAILCFSRARLPGAVATKRGEHRMTDLIRNAPLRRALIISGITETGGELYNFYMPIYGRSIGLAASTIGLTIGSFAIATLLMRVVMPMLIRKSNEHAVLLGSLALSAAACAVFPLITNVYLLGANSFVLGLGLGSCTPLSLIMIYNSAPQGRGGEAIGLRQSVTKFTEVMVPALFGTLGSAIGLASSFWIVALMFGGSAYLMRTVVPHRIDVWRSGR